MGPKSRHHREAFRPVPGHLACVAGLGQVDADQLRRFLADQAKKQALYGASYPIDEDFLAALEHGLPDCAGIALGFDRLVMIAAGAEDIEDVLWAPVR